ncbi:MAG: heme-binding protein [Candidatus Tectomicrobia bacterium]
MSITLEEADRALAAAIAKANEQGTKMNIAVVDAGGRLVAFKRMNGAIWAGVYGSQGKAVASAAFGRDSGVMQERAGAPIIQGIMVAEGGHMIPSQGAVPILRNGVVIGAIGCGGGTGQEDEDCARAGAAAV